MKLYIIRHGQTEWNRLKKLQGQTNIPLNEEGIRLAKLTGEHMKEIPIDLVISSPLDRAVKTAELVTGNRDIPIITDNRIIEISFGEWEGEQTETTKKIPPDYLEHFYHAPLLCERPPKGENFPDVLKRTGEFYRELVSNPDYKDKTILISTHGAAGRCFLSNFYEDKEDIWRGGVPVNCSVCIGRVENGIGTLLEKDVVYY